MVTQAGYYLVRIMLEIYRKQKGSGKHRYLPRAKNMRNSSHLRDDDIER